MTLESRIAETLAALQWLASQPDIDPDHIGIVGYNQGAIMATAAAGRSGAGQVKSIALWLPIANPIYQYTARASVEKFEAGLESRAGELVEVKTRSGAIKPLKQGFYRDVWTLNPAAEIVPYKGAMLVVMSNRYRDAPAELGQGLLRYHSGVHELLSLDIDQGLGAFQGPAGIDDLALRTLSWFSKTLVR
jgi:hypothetical protein